MTFISNKTESAAVLQGQKMAVLKSLEPKVEQLMLDHVQKRTLWLPGECLPADEQMGDAAEAELQELRQRAKTIPDAIRVSIALNLLTEEGLPHFHRLLTTCAGNESVWGRWNFMWTAEEDRHGSVLRDYVRDTRLFKLGELEKIQYHYLESGFTPSWDGDCYAVFVYTTIQEKATQIAHRNTGNQVAHYEPALKRILSKVAGDEARHHNFYREVLSGILQADPKGALKAMLPLFPGIDMPGVAMSSYKLMADVEYRSGIYGPFEYKRIIEELIQFLGLSKLSGLDGEAEQIRDKLMKVPARLQKVGEFYERRSQAKAFSFSFLYDRVFNLG